MVKNYFLKCRNKFSSIKNDEKGAVSILTVIFLSVIIFFVFFIVFDYSTYTEQKQKVQFYADNAAAAVAQKSVPATFPTVIDRNGTCYSPFDLARLNPYTCEVVVKKDTVLFDVTKKLEEKTDGIAHSLAMDVFNLEKKYTEQGKMYLSPKGEKNPIKKYEMTVEIYDAIDGETYIETDNGKYKVTRPTVVVKVWATIEGPFLGKDIEEIAVGVYETSLKPVTDSSVVDDGKGSSIIIGPVRP